MCHKIHPKQTYSYLSMCGGCNGSEKIEQNSDKQSLLTTEVFDYMSKRFTCLLWRDLRKLSELIRALMTNLFRIIDACIFFYMNIHEG